MIRMSLKICLVIAALLGSVSVGYAGSHLPKCLGSPKIYIKYENSSQNAPHPNWDNCYGTLIYGRTASASRYTGEFKKSRRSGEGVMFYPALKIIKEGIFKGHQFQYSKKTSYSTKPSILQTAFIKIGERIGKKIQTILSDLGFYKASIDGLYGDKTAAALVAYNKQYQYGADLTQSTNVKNLFRSVLLQPLAHTQLYIMYYKFPISSRKKIQTVLSDLGFYKSSVDGLYGKGTAGALTEYNEIYLGNADLTKTANVTKLLASVLMEKTAYLLSIILKVQKGPDLLDNPLRFWPAANDMAIIQRNLKLVDFRKLSINGFMTKETIAALRRYNYFHLGNADLKKGKNVDKLLDVVLAISDQKVCSPETQTTIEFCKVCSPETPEKCTTSFLCINATTKSGSSTMWSSVPGRKNYVKEAQSRGLFCEVKEQSAKPKVVPIPAPKVVEEPKPITESEALKFKRIKKELGLSYYGSFIHSERLPNTLFFFSDIEKNDSFEFRKALRNHDINLIVLSSPGGSVFEGLQISGIIYDKNLKTYIPKNSLFGSGNCASACSFMFFAGEGRSAEGDLGVHQFYSGKASDEGKIGTTQKRVQFTVSEIIGFLNEFETPAWVYERMFQQSEMYYFKESELLQLETEVSEETKAQHDKAESFISDFRAAFKTIGD